MIDRHAPRAAILTRHGLSHAAPTVALLPGSRHNEVASTLPTMLEACARLRAEEPDLQFLIARAPGLHDRQFEAVLRSHLPIGVHEGDTDAVLAASDLVITASGTATVQTALHGKPMVIVYRLSPLTYRLGRPFVKVDTFGMVNLIAGRRIVPELIQDDFTAERVCEEALRFLRDQRVRRRRPRRTGRRRAGTWGTRRLRPCRDGRARTRRRARLHTGRPGLGDSCRLMRLTRHRLASIAVLLLMLCASRRPVRGLGRRAALARAVDRGGRPRRGRRPSSTSGRCRARTALERVVQLQVTSAWKGDAERTVFVRLAGGRLGRHRDARAGRAGRCMTAIGWWCSS